MNDSDLNRTLDAALRKLPLEVLPRRDLWPGIAHAIQAPEQRSWPRMMALAASVMLMIGLGLYFGAMQPMTVGPNSAVEDFLATLQNEHEMSKNALLVQFEGTQAAYPDWEVQMRQLEQAEDVVYQALRDDPGNIELVKILRQVQDKQMKLIDAVFDPRLNSI